LNGKNFIPACDEKLGIPCLGRWVAGDIDNPFRLKLQGLLNEVLVTPFAGRVYDQ
jgi:hypothetical protein